MAYFDPDFSQFRSILNGGPMVAWIAGQGASIAAAAAAATHKRTGFNAGSFRLAVKTGGSVFGDRAEASVVNTNTRYGLERELGGRVNPFPERSLYAAMKGVSGGHAVASPKIVHGGPARRAKPKPFLNADKYNRGS